MALARRSVGEDGAALAGAADAPAGLPQTASAGPGGDGRDLLCAADGLLVERTKGDGHLLVFLSAAALSGVG